MVDNHEEGINSEELETTEGIISENPEDDDSDSYESDDEGTVEEQGEEERKEIKPKNKTAEKFKKILSEKNQLRNEVEAIKMELALEKLAKSYGEINVDEVKSVKEQNKSLSWEDCVILWNAKKPKVETKTKSGGMIGRESSPKNNYVTDAELSKMSVEEYSIAMDKIKEGKLIHKAG